MTVNPAPIVVEETYAVEAHVVWRAITDPAQMSQWYFEPIRSFKPEVGFETEFNLSFEGTDYPHIWKVTEAVPNKRVAYTFELGGYEGATLLQWELSEVDGGTKLTLTSTGGETFPQDNPVFTREAGLAGWQYLLNESLKKFLEPSA